MKPEYKRRLLDALRSGVYTQGHCRLATFSETDTQTPSAFCCLGVACTLLPPEMKRNVRWWLPTLTVDQQEEIGLDSDAMFVLWKMNDGYDGSNYLQKYDPNTFVEIADWIEANL